MEKERYRKLAVGLGILWLVSVFVLFAAYYGVSVGVANARGVHPMEVFAQYSDIIILVWIVIFIPMLFFVQRFFRKAEMKNLAVVSRILFIHQAVCGGLLACLKIVGMIFSFAQS